LERSMWCKLLVFPFSWISQFSFLVYLFNRLPANLSLKESICFLFSFPWSVLFGFAFPFCFNFKLSFMLSFLYVYVFTLTIHLYFSHFRLLLLFTLWLMYCFLFKLAGTLPILLSKALTDTMTGVWSTQTFSLHFSNSSRDSYVFATNKQSVNWGESSGESGDDSSDEENNDEEKINEVATESESKAFVD